MDEVTWHLIDCSSACRDLGEGSMLKYTVSITLRHSADLEMFKHIIGISKMETRSNQSDSCLTLWGRVATKL